MPRFRKKPVEIEAMQWDGTLPSFTAIVDWSMGRQLGVKQPIHYRSNSAAPGCPGLHEAGPFRYCCEKGCQWSDDGPTLSIDTLEGSMTAHPGDWIIRGVQGEFYPCKPDIFEETYEAA